MDIVEFEDHELPDEIERLRHIVAQADAGELYALRYAVDSDGHKSKLNEGTWSPGYGYVQLWWVSALRLVSQVIVKFEGDALVAEIERLRDIVWIADEGRLYRLRYAVDNEGHKLKLNELVWSPGYGQVQR